MAPGADNDLVKATVKVSRAEPKKKARRGRHRRNKDRSLGFLPLRSVPQFQKPDPAEVRSKEGRNGKLQSLQSSDNTSNDRAFLWPKCQPVASQTLIATPPAPSSVLSLQKGLTAAARLAAADAESTLQKRIVADLAEECANHLRSVSEGESKLTMKAGHIIDLVVRNYGGYARQNRDWVLTDSVFSVLQEDLRAHQESAEVAGRSADHKQELANVLRAKMRVPSSVIISDCGSRTSDIEQAQLVQADKNEGQRPEGGLQQHIHQVSGLESHGSMQQARASSKVLSTRYSGVDSHMQPPDKDGLTTQQPTAKDGGRRTIFNFG